MLNQYKIIIIETCVSLLDMSEILNYISTHINYREMIKIKPNAIIHTESYYNILQSLKTDTNNVIMFITVDLFQHLCSTDPNEPMIIYNRLKELEKYMDIYPSIDFLYATGSKKYTLNETIANYMLPNTYIYPKDYDDIFKLKPNNYIIKYGFTSVNTGVFLDNGDGAKIIKKIESLNKTKEKGIHCKDNIVIIQPESAIFDKCDELKFGIIGNKIIGIQTSKYQLFTTKIITDPYKNTTINNKEFYSFLQNIENINKWENLEELPDKVHDKNYINFIKSSCNMMKPHKKYSQGGKILSNVYYKPKNKPYIILKLNNKIYKFIKEVMEKINKIYTNNLYVRLDIIYQCNDKYDFVTDNDIGNIYINEIEPYGSGLKAQMYPIIDNNKCGFINIRQLELTKDGDLKSPFMIYDELHEYIFLLIDKDQLIKRILYYLNDINDKYLNDILKLLN